jgi:hypothetical protein
MPTKEIRMALFVISYDLRKQRNYQPLYDCLNKWGAARLLESLWLAELAGPAAPVRDILTSLIDADDGVAVIELKAPFNWATMRTQQNGTAWLKSKSP